MQDWFLSNKLSLNNSKTQSSKFTFRQINPDVPLANSVKFLGVHLDPGLTWEQHVNCLSSKLSRVTYWIRGLADSVSGATLISAYHGYFGANMSYAIWICSSHAGKFLKYKEDAFVLWWGWAIVIAAIVAFRHSEFWLCRVFIFSVYIQSLHPSECLCLWNSRSILFST